MQKADYLNYVGRVRNTKRIGILYNIPRDHLDKVVKHISKIDDVLSVNINNYCTPSTIKRYLVQTYSDIQWEEKHKEHCWLMFLSQVQENSKVMVFNGAETLTKTGLDFVDELENENVPVILISSNSRFYPRLRKRTDYFRKVMIELDYKEVNQTTTR